MRPDFQMLRAKKGRRENKKNNKSNNEFLSIECDFERSIEILHNFVFLQIEVFLKYLNSKYVFEISFFGRLFC